VSLLADLLLELMESAVEPSTERGLVAAFTAGSIVLAAVTAWLVMTFPDPLREPEWGLGVLASAVLCGAGGVLVSILHLRRNESDRLFGVLSLILNAGAMAIPLAQM
jgi:hypothetical protein